MTRDLLPEDLLISLDKGRLAPLYLLHGPDEFRMERFLSKVRESFIPESSRDFNLEICYGDEVDPSEIVNRARTIPFLAENRLIIVRRTEEFTSDQLDKFLPYLDDPSPSTCFIFISSRTDFKRRFYKKIRELGFAVNFSELKSNQIVPWIRRAGKELGLNIDPQVCVYLQQVVGNRLRDLYSELEKLQLRYGSGDIGKEQVRELAIHGRIYSIFELMDALSEKDRSESLSVLNRFLEEEDKRRGPLQVLGMLNRQIGLLWQTKAILEKNGKTKDVASKLRLIPFSASKLIKQSKHWTPDELENGISLLYETDRLLKAGLRPRPVLESLILSLCG
jgi:DNA polymerase-3 subunit delta